jgi:hypothetical protein
MKRFQAPFPGTWRPGPLHLSPIEEPAVPVVSVVEPNAVNRFLSTSTRSSHLPLRCSCVSSRCPIP